MDAYSVYVRDNLSGKGLTYLAALAGVYCVCLAVYRITFDPLASFPGPKIAALTGYYEFYYDFFRNGTYTFQIEKMHQKYGTRLGQKLPILYIAIETLLTSSFRSNRQSEPSRIIYS